MTSPDPAALRDTTHRSDPSGLQSLYSPAAVILAGVAWNAGAWLVDASPIGQGADLFGWSFLAVLATAVVGGPLLVLTLFAAAVASLAPTMARGAIRGGAGLCVLAGFVLGATGLVVLLGGGGDSDAAFAVVTLASAVVLLAPAWTTWDV